MPLPQHGALGMSFLGCRVLQFISLVVMMGLTAHFISDIADGSQNPPPPIVAILSITCFAILYIIISTILYWDQQLPLLPSAAVDFLFFLALMITSIIVGKPLSALSCPAVGKSGSVTFLDAHAATSLMTDLAPTPTTSVTAAAAVVTTAATTTVQGEQATITAYTTVQQMVTQTAAFVAATLAPGTTEATVKGSNGQVYNVHEQRSYSAGNLHPRDVGDATSSAVLKAVQYDDWVRVSSRTCTMMKAVWGFGITLTILFLFTCFAAAFLWKSTRVPGPARIKKASVEDA